jgi:integrase/recombinase XerD
VKVRRKRLNMAEREAGMIYPPESLRAFAERHYESLQERNYSDETVMARRGYLRKFFEWSDERGVTELSQVTSGLIERYQKYLYHYRKEKTGEPISFTHQAVQLSHIREFFRWCVRKGFLAYNPAADLEMPRPEQRLPKYILTIDEVEQILACIDLNTPDGVRERAIIEILYSTGMRRMELAKLRLYDIDTDRGTVMIRQGKGKKDRMIPIGERAVMWLSKFIVEERPHTVQGIDPGTIFLNAHGTEFNVDQISVIVKDCIERSGVQKKGACHLFRHTMATLLLENGADVRFVQAMLGHSSLRSTEIYTHVAIKKLKEIHTALHPGANIEPRHESGEAGAKDEKKEEVEPS